MTKVTQQEWLDKANNLQERRKREVIKNSVAGVDDYCKHINSIEIGASLLDVGCGSCILMSCIPENVRYVGIDPFPEENSFVTKTTIEDCTFEDGEFDTIAMFAALDNVQDFDKAIEQIKRVCNKNVLFLTGVNIEPDKYHTIKITESLLIDKMKPFKVGHMKYLHEKILLIEFVK